MLSKQDKEFLKETFATKDDLRQTVREELAPVKSKLNTIIRIFDKQLNHHHRRLEQLEGIANVKPPPFLVPRSSQ